MAKSLSVPHPFRRFRSVGLLSIAACVTAALVVVVAMRPEFILVVPAAFAAIWFFSRDRSALNGYGLGSGLAILVIGASNSAPTAIRIGSVALATIVVVAGAAGGTPSRARTPSAGPVWLAFLAYTATVTLVTGSSSIATVIATFVTPVVAVLAARRMGARDLLAFAKVIFTVAATQVGLCLLEISVLGQPIWGYRNVGADGQPVLRFNPFFGDAILRAQGTLGHPILLALLMLLTFFLAVSRITAANRTLRVAGVTIALAGLLLSGTRSAAIAFVVALAYSAISTSGLVRRTRNVVALIGVGALAFILDFGLQRMIINLLESDSLGHRVDGWAATSDLLGRDPLAVLFGTGVNSEQSVFSAGFLQQDGFNVIDNQLITTFVTSGLVGLAIFVGALMYSWARTTSDGRALLLSIAVMFFSFDLTTWHISLAIVTIAVCFPRAAWQAYPPGALESVKMTEFAPR